MVYLYLFVFLAGPRVWCRLPRAVRWYTVVALAVVNLSAEANMEDTRKLVPMLALGFVPCIVGVYHGSDGLRWGWQPDTMIME